MLDILRREREQAEPERRIAPIAVQPHLLKGDSNRIARLRAFDVKRASERIAGLRMPLHVFVILSPGVERLGDNNVPRLDSLQNRVLMRKRAVVAIGNDLVSLGVRGQDENSGEQEF